jgi:L-threonylcarbamoyladenylate synthase
VSKEHKNIVNIDEQLDLAIDLSVNLYQSGKIFIYPTDTIYGIGGNPFDKKVIESISEVKGRNEKKQFIWLLSDIDSVLNYVELSSETHYNLLQNIWPGPVSVVFKLNERTNHITNFDTIAIRVPDNYFCQRMLKEIKQPLISTSVNFSSQAVLVDNNEIIEKFSPIVDATFLTTAHRIGLHSTIIDLSMSEPKLIREGSVKFIELLKNLK